MDVLCLDTFLGMVHSIFINGGHKLRGALWLNVREHNDSIEGLWVPA